MAIKKPWDPQQPTTLALHNAVTWPLHTVRGSEGRSHEAVPGSSQHRNKKNFRNMRYSIWILKCIGTKETAGIRDKASNLELPKIKFRRYEIQNIKSLKVSECSSIPANHSNVSMKMHSCSLLRFYRNSIIRNFKNCTNLDFFSTDFDYRHYEDQLMKATPPRLSVSAAAWQDISEDRHSFS